MVSCVTILPVPGANGGACACFTLHTIPHGSAMPRPGGHAHTPLPGTNTSLAPSAASEIREIRCVGDSLRQMRERVRRLGVRVGSSCARRVRERVRERATMLGCVARLRANERTSERTRVTHRPGPLAQWS